MGSCCSSLFDIGSSSLDRSLASAPGGSITNNRYGESTASSVSVDEKNPGGEVLQAPSLHIFTFSELRKATGNFQSPIGDGGFGMVYKGWIDEKTLKPTIRGVGMAIAVKRLHPDSGPGLEALKKEVNFLGRFSHPNLVKLLGYCLENRARILVYEFLTGGSLDRYLYGRAALMEPLSWSCRLKIALGAARGLEFLHCGQDIVVIHRDLKASNILLDSNFKPKLSDFGLAESGPTGDRTHVSTEVVGGTYGYAAPEYIATGHLYVKSDVYGFGVILLEILTGLKAFDRNRPRGQEHLVNWAKPLLSDRSKLSRLIDSRLGGQWPTKGAYVAAKLTLRCIAGKPNNRPLMSEVVQALEQIST